jgi:indolepyruvate ferredoxin oxidoreductase, alpha subunit
MQKVLLGVEAIAQGAIDGGMSGVYAYPGTPSTEITEYIQNNRYAVEKNIHRQWSANEKTAMEAALGMSYAGKRAMVCMKHVGLNVAADCFMNAAVTGVNGGLIVTVADDPSMHSSQNEQDSRYFGRFAQIPILEPTNQQEAYDMAYTGFEFSEKYKVPVLLRITTRLAHSRAIVKQSEVKIQNNLNLPTDPKQFILMPAIARRQYHKLLGNQASFEQESEQSVYNQYIDGKDKSLGIIACGIAFNYLMENYPDGCPNPVVKISQYPIPQTYINQLVNSCKTILVMEEGYPIIEELFRGYPYRKNIKGRLDGTLPREGELNPDHVAKALGLPVANTDEVDSLVTVRPPALCTGCSHHDVYGVLNQVMEKYTKGRVFSDIGCYTLAALPPYNAIYSCVDMGASITMAKGAADAGLIPSVAVIGDSTFTHSGMTALLDAVYENSPITVIISDNESTSMTGGQEPSGKGRLESICEGLGVHPDHIHVLTPLKKNHEQMAEVFAKEIDYPGVSVIIPRRVCIQKNARDVKAAKKDKKS